MRIDESPRWPRLESLPWVGVFLRSLSDNWLRMAQQVNGMASGRVDVVSNADSAAPTTGSAQAGDFVRNSAPAEAGTAGSKYVVIGFLCVAAGSPGTWVECRALTGN